MPMAAHTPRMPSRIHFPSSTAVPRRKITMEPTPTFMVNFASPGRPQAVGQIEGGWVERQRQQVMQKDQQGGQPQGIRGELIEWEQHRQQRRHRRTSSPVAT